MSEPFRWLRGFAVLLAVAAIIALSVMLSGVELGLPVGDRAPMLMPVPTPTVIPWSDLVHLKASVERDWVRVTFYGPDYGLGDLMMSGELYDPDGWFCALGPYLLAQARQISGERWPEVHLFLYRDGALRHYLLPVWDSGLAALEVDLGDGTWTRLTGLPFEAGVVRGYLFVEKLGDLTINP